MTGIFNKSKYYPTMCDALLKENIIDKAKDKDWYSLELGREEQDLTSSTDLGQDKHQKRCLDVTRLPTDAETENTPRNHKCSYSGARIMVCTCWYIHIFENLRSRSERVRTQ